MIQNTRGVDHLPSDVVVVQMPNEEGLRGEGIRLNVNVGVGHDVHERGFAHVWVASKDQSPRGRIDGRQPSQMLPHLFKVRERAGELLCNGAHAAHRRLLQHLALVQAICELHHSHVFLGNVVYDLFARVHLPKGQFVVVPVVKHVAEVGIEGVNVVDLGKFLDDLGELFSECGLAVLDFPHVKRANPGDLEARVHDRGSLPLGA
mmetsp:Transcript_56924/g.123174  ORF Transcript_56924/g.123174 Transcript_56924/m.123174 type:complete len:205 (-) Transcript_56924:135-749(-)